MKLASLIAAAAIALPILPTTAAAEPKGIKNVVLVHGAFADGSGWSGVAMILRKEGYNVSIVQHPETSFDDDVKATQRILDMQSGQTVLVGHSYGGSVITEAGNHSKVAALVYVAAFQPDTGETTGMLAEKIPAASKATRQTADGYLYLDFGMFPADFAADVPVEHAEFMARSQVFVAAASFGAKITNAAWRNKPSYAVVAESDRAINPDLERWMTKRAGSTVVEIKGASHAVYVSHPKEVASLIVQAATQTPK